MFAYNMTNSKIIFVPYFLVAYLYPPFYVWILQHNVKNVAIVPRAKRCFEIVLILKIYDWFCFSLMFSSFSYGRVILYLLYTLFYNKPISLCDILQTLNVSANLCFIKWPLSLWCPFFLLKILSGRITLPSMFFNEVFLNKCKL